MTRRRRVAAIASAVILAGGGIGLTASCAPTCPEGQVAEWDDDGYECEPDVNGDGVDDEDD